MTDVQSLIHKACLSNPADPRPLTLAAGDLIRRGRHDLAAACQYMADAGKRPPFEGPDGGKDDPSWWWFRSGAFPDLAESSELPGDLADLLLTRNGQCGCASYTTAYDAVAALAEALAIKRSEEQSARSDPHTPTGEGPVPTGEMP